MPDGFFMFYQRSSGPNKGIAGGSIDAWSNYGCLAIADLPQRRRMKCTVMYDNVIFGFALVDVDEPEFQFIEGWQVPLLTKACRSTPVAAQPYLPPPGLINNAATRLGVRLGVRI